jgi:DNA-binding GntR family transcriptional regulator
MHAFGSDLDEGLNLAVYAELRTRLVNGRMSPGQEISTRGLAAEMNTSQTPIRDALARLAAEGALEIRSKRRVVVRGMTPERFNDLHRCRLLLEPEAAVGALPFIDDARLERLGQIEASLSAAIVRGDADAFMQCNSAFHFELYQSPAQVALSHLIETLWLQFGPFMRQAQTRMGAASLIDGHQVVLDAIVARDEQWLRAAITADIDVGMKLILSAGFLAQVRGASHAA